MLNITIYTSLDVGIENVETKAKELALLLSYYTGERINLNTVIVPLSSSNIVVPSIRINDFLFDNLDISEVITKIISKDVMYSILSLNDGANVVSIV